MTLANKITIFRLFLAIIYFLILYLIQTGHASDPATPLDIACIIFFITAILDIVDGYVARLLNQTSGFGRRLDPLVDKVIICGSFIFLLRIAPISEILEPWMVVIIIVREFMVQGVRVDMESRGVAFGAGFWGKQKTFLQSFTIVGFLLYAAHFHKFDFYIVIKTFLVALVWLTLISTLISGVLYCVDAARYLKTGKIHT
jgi:CDP-diacylglycerol--glycerol-3-phosphate 3-phosphatidyltransferase